MTNQTRYMCCPKCKTHTNQTLYKITDTSFKWKCDICHHQMKKNWTVDQVDKIPESTARLLLFKCQSMLLSKGVSKNDPLMKEIDNYWYQSKIEH